MRFSTVALRIGPARKARSGNHEPATLPLALVDGGGNIPPELNAVRRLIQRGHAVTVLGDDSVASEVASAGASFRRWTRAPNRRDRRPENDPACDWECKYPWQLIDRLSKTLFVGPAEYARDVGEAIANIQPVLVICSMFCVGGMVAAEAAGVPFDVLLSNVYLFSRGRNASLWYRASAGRRSSGMTAPLRPQRHHPAPLGFPCAIWDQLGQAPTPLTGHRAFSRSGTRCSPRTDSHVARFRLPR